MRTCGRFELREIQPRPAPPPSLLTTTGQEFTPGVRSVNDDVFPSAGQEFTPGVGWLGSSFATAG